MKEINIIIESYVGGFIIWVIIVFIVSLYLKWIIEWKIYIYVFVI